MWGRGFSDNYAKVPKVPKVSKVFWRGHPWADFLENFSDDS